MVRPASSPSTTLIAESSQHFDALVVTAVVEEFEALLDVHTGARGQTHCRLLGHMQWLGQTWQSER